ncbi:hypothetical protein [uncultured Aquitalea sp.]|uniref:hypothetical protein n=1 Tax=uncultured Aquitalea sp. TaxID=540272 RepID=UPI0025F66F28|nr:hypothetical protein [uncultured Aquitalea sp.]
MSLFISLKFSCFAWGHGTASGFSLLACVLFGFPLLCLVVLLGVCRSFVLSLAAFLY